SGLAFAIRTRSSAGGAAHYPGAEPERIPASPPLLELREAEPAAFTLSLLRLDEICQRPVQIAERLLVGPFGVLPPPGQRRADLLLYVPQLVQLRSRVPLALGLVALLTLRQTPVPREPGRAGMRPQHPLLCWGRIQREPVRLRNLHGSFPVTAATALAARDGRTAVLIASVGSSVRRHRACVSAASWVASPAARQPSPAQARSLASATLATAG